MSEVATLSVKEKSLLSATGAFSVMTLLSRIAGLMRDTVVGVVFGVVMGVDAYNVAAKIPNFLRRIFAEGAFSQAFVPVLSEHIQQNKPEALREFVRHMSALWMTILFIIVFVAMLFAPWVIQLFAPGYSRNPEQFSMATTMLRITFPYIFFISLTAFQSAILNSLGRFAIPAFAPVLMNLTMITTALFLPPYLSVGVYALAWGMFFSGVIQFAFQLPFLAQLKLLLWPRLNWRDPGVLKVLKLMAPRLVGASISQINLLLDTVFATFLPIGSVTWLFYSDRLIEFPLGMFGVAIGTVVLPYLSRRHAAADNEKYSQAIDWGLRTVLIFAVPSTIGLFILAKPLMATFFQYGKFSAYDVNMAGRSLMAFSLGLCPFMAIKVLISGFFAKHDSRTPMWIGVVAMVLNTTLNFFLMQTSLAHAGLALSTSIAAWLNAGLLLIFLCRREVYSPNPKWIKFLCQLVLSGLILIAFILWAQGTEEQWLAWRGSVRALHLLTLVASSGILYFATLWLTGLRFNDFLGKFS